MYIVTTHCSHAYFLNKRLISDKMASIRRSLLSLLRFSGAVRTSSVTNSRVQVLCSNTGEMIGTTWSRKLSWYRRYNSISGEDSHANKTLYNQEETEKRLSGLTLSDSCVKVYFNLINIIDTNYFK